MAKRRFRCSRKIIILLILLLILNSFLYIYLFQREVFFYYPSISEA